jgi:triosephosphate isomerase
MRRGVCVRIPIIAGNWKMNNTLEEAQALLDELKPMVKGAICEVVICPAYVHLNEIVKAVHGSDIKVAAQNMHYEDSGAFTGEVSAPMLSELGVSYVIVGHSERRQYFNETDITVNKKIKAAFKNGLIPIVCCGETLSERSSGTTGEVLENQITAGLRDLSKKEISGLVVAYEPVWAIGTGKIASDEQANETISLIRGLIRRMYGQEAAEEVRIQYGGSVKPSTIGQLMSQPHIDGTLVGGASLKAGDFAEIVKGSIN